MSTDFPSWAETERVKAAIATTLAAHNVELAVGSDWSAGRAAIYSNTFVYGDYCYTCAIQMLRGPAFALVFYETALINDFQRFHIKNSSEVADVVEAYLKSVSHVK